MRKSEKKKRNGNRKTRHHIWNRVNGGYAQEENMLTLKQEKHNLFHQLFGNLDLYDVILLLIRIARAKHYHKVNPKIKVLYEFV